jgi:glycopeptide antibiotics resistance protein
MGKLDRMIESMKNKNDEAINPSIDDLGNEKAVRYDLHLLQGTWWLYLITLIILLIRPFMGIHYQVRRFNLIPLKTVILYINGYNYSQSYDSIHNLLGNVILFIPFGFLLPLCFGKGKSLFKIIFYTFLLSFLAELWQLVFKVGIFDVDDILLNVVGGVIGFLIYRIIYRDHS